MAWKCPGLLLWTDTASFGPSSGNASWSIQRPYAQGAALAHDGSRALRVHLLDLSRRRRAGRARLHAARGHVEVKRRNGGHGQDLLGMAATLRCEVAAAAKAAETDPTPSIGPTSAAGELREDRAGGCPTEGLREPGG